MTLQIAMAAASRCGRERQLNEDALGANGWALWSNAGVRYFPPTRDQHFLTDPAVQPLTFAVADGLGGIPGAQQASLLAVEATTGLLREASDLADLLTDIQSALHTLQSQNPHVGSMGAVIAGVTFSEQGTPVCFNVGDARAYYTHIGSLIQATRDDAELMPFATRTRLTKWLGQPGVERVEPWLRQLEGAEERWLLLCTDGFYSAVAHETMEAIMCDRSLTSPAARLHRLFTAAGTTEDDASVMVICVRPWPQAGGRR